MHGVHLSNAVHTAWPTLKRDILTALNGRHNGYCSYLPLFQVGIKELILGIVCCQAGLIKPLQVDHMFLRFCRLVFDDASGKKPHPVIVPLN